MKNPVLKAGMVCLLMMACTLVATPQRGYPDMRLWVSDIHEQYIVFHYEGVEAANCQYQTPFISTEVTIFRDNLDTKVTQYPITNLDAATFLLETGPDVSGTWALKYREYSNIWVLPCDKYVLSGFPPSQAGEIPDGYTHFIHGKTTSLYAPLKIAASRGEYLDKVKLTWEKGTYLEDSINIQGKGLTEILFYKIYKGKTFESSSLVTQLPSNTFTWTDSTLVPNDSINYWVTTFTTQWGGHESVRNADNSVMGTTKLIGLKASDGAYANRVKLDWNDLSAVADGIRVERSIPGKPGEKEELDVLNKYARAFSDMDAIPGCLYTYFITPTFSSKIPKTESDQGYIKPNGVINGYVKSLMGAGVNGVKVCATPVSPLPGSAITIPPEGYCTLTDKDGYFDIRNIYYYDEAKFTIVPAKGVPGNEHLFEPDTITRILDLTAKVSSGVNFTDQSVFTVAGRITFPAAPNGAVCGVPDVGILINGQNRAVNTDTKGYWSYAIQDEDTFTFKPVFKHHVFKNGSGKPETRLFVNDDFENINFTDVQTDSVMIRVQNGCGDPVANKAKVTITAAENCYYADYFTDAKGLLTLRDLPARKYTVQVVDLDPVSSNIMDQIGFKPVEVDLTVRDTTDVFTPRETMIITPADTMRFENDSIYIQPADTTYATVIDTTRSEVIPRTDFIFHSPILVTVDFREAGAEVFEGCKVNPEEDIVLMEQDIPYNLVFEVTETSGGCYVSEGKLRIFDFVGDKGDEPVEIPIVNGKAVYRILPGLPEIATSVKHNHEKLLYVVPEVGFITTRPVEFWIMVTGVKTQAPSFITRSPEFPMLVLHDPPGDKSSAFVEKGSEFKWTHTTEELVGGEGGVYANLVIGTKFKGWFVDHGFGIQFKLSAVSGKDNTWRHGVETTLGFTEKFSTSDMEELTGADGDIYMGASFNQEFALGEELSFSRDSCKAIIRTVPTVDYTGFATTFVYTEKHIRNSLLPTLGLLRNALIAGRKPEQLSEEEKVQANQFLYDSLHWENVLSKNRANRDTNAVFKSNVSFSAGAPYSNEFSTSVKTSDGYEYNRFVNLEFALGVKLTNEGGLWYDSELGVTAKFRYSYKINNATEDTETRKVGYTLDDGDVGDYFSVDIKEDTAFRVPAFALKLGTTSCPHEQGSQPRDDARIQIYPPQINNVPIGEKALFTASLLNQSQSRETRDYGVRVIPTTNPDGAIVSIGGQQINNGEALFTLKYNQITTIALTVEKGPLASNYDSLGIVIYPPCEYELGEVTSGDTAWFFVDFQSVCSNVALHLPGDGWLVNKNDNDILHVAFTGYDLNNERLESITLQCKLEGQGWIDYYTVMKESLTGFFFDYDFDVSGLPDGNYRIRAKAYCGPEGGFSYSSEQLGKIDRSSVAPFGMPSPADGYLRYGQEISVTFDKDIDCNFNGYNPAQPEPTIKLFTADSTEIPITVQCSGNYDKLILVPDEDLFLLPELEGVRLFASVTGIRDVSGNVQQYPTQWSFLVNVSPVSWNPEEVFQSVELAENVVISANLDNSSVISKAFLITEWPEWVIPSVTSASILPGNSFPVNFTTTGNLEPGLYTGQVTAMVDDVPEILTITLELYAREINWIVNGHNFEYNMNVVAQFSRDEGDLAQSVNTRDKVAAYIDGEMRGVANMTYIPGLNRYAAFLQVFSNLPGKNGSLIEGEEYIADLSVQKVTVTDEGTTSGAVRFKKSNWIDFDIYASKAGNHTAGFRVASIKPGTAQILVDGILVQTLLIPNTGSLAAFATLTAVLQVGQGLHKMRIQSVDAEFDLNWFNFPQFHVRNKNSGEIIRFRMWDGLNGIEFGAVEELTFFNDGKAGQAEQPFLLHPAGGIQDVPLQKGWNWISVNKLSDDMGVAKVFESITPPASLNDLTLKSQTAFSQFIQATGWQGNLTTVDPRLGYMIYLSNHADTLSMVGNTPGDGLTFNLNPNWNWIGYPESRIMGVNDYLTGLTAKAGDVLKSQFAFTEYNETTGGWIGDLRVLQPGKGYKLFLSQGGVLDMLKSGTSGNLDLQYEFNMTLTAALRLGSLPLSEDLYLQAFINGAVRGVVPLTYVDPLGENMAFVMIYGNRSDIGESVELQLWDEIQQREIALTGEEIRFEIDQIRGTLRNPVLLSVQDPGTKAKDVKDSGMFTVWPNPFSGQAFIRYSIPAKSKVSVTITNSLGAIIAVLTDTEQPVGSYQVVFRAEGLVPGMYFCTLKTGNAFQTRKIILY